MFATMVRIWSRAIFLCYYVESLIQLVLVRSPWSLAAYPGGQRFVMYDINDVLYCLEKLEFHASRKSARLIQYAI